MKNSKEILEQHILTKMEIKKVELENIRSYEKAEIEFPKGSVLLSGDIGSGKSSVLLAVEFALFGMQKGSISGNSLLRNGAEKGKVKVNFVIDGKEISIERNLKRGKKSVTQESGNIIINNEKKDVATQELRSYVLRMLNYPSEFQTKRPELYRYTVYTPQEGMKQILTENVDARLNTLRRVFAMDKYKRIGENVNLFSARLRESIRNKEGMIADLDVKKENLAERKKEADNINNDLKKIQPQLAKTINLVLEKKKSVDDFEKRISELNILKTKLATAESQLSVKSERLTEIEEQLEDSDGEIKKLTARLSGVKLGDVPKLIKGILDKISKKEKEKKEAETKRAESDKKVALLERKRAELSEMKNNIGKLDICPTCNQRVSSQYKSVIVSDIEIKLRKVIEDITLFSTEKSNIEKKISALENELEVLIEKQSKADDLRITSINFEEKQKTVKRLEAEMMKLNEDNKKNVKERKELRGRIKAMNIIEQNYSKAKQELDIIREQQKEVEIRKGRVDEQLQSINNIIKDLMGEIQKKEEIKLNISKHNKIKDWLGEQFIPLIGFIEKNVMLKLHHEFNIFFEKWFNMLVASEGLQARLDENFTPVIEQSGYDIDYAYLSGGERTAAALAYRLSLNQVINSMLSHIKTRDLLVLDEPTDGFSAEQLDKMKDVLGEINAKQIILVSHENKIENFVDNIIRFEKEGHVSKIGVG